MLKTAINTLHQRLITTAGSLKEKTILDYGCGNGKMIKILLETPQQPFIIYAVDNNPALLQELAHTFKEEISRNKVKPVIVSDPKELRGMVFDVIFCHNVLELIDNKEQFVSNLYNLLAPDGTLVLSHIDFDSMIFNSSFKELTRILIHHFADTKQPWMQNIDGQIGRKIPGILHRAHLNHFNFETWRWTEMTFKESDYGHLIADLFLKEPFPNTPEENLLNWKQDLESKATQKEYFFAVDIDVATITKQ